MSGGGGTSGPRITCPGGHLVRGDILSSDTVPRKAGSNGFSVVISESPLLKHCEL